MTDRARTGEANSEGSGQFRHRQRGPWSCSRDRIE